MNGSESKDCRKTQVSMAGTYVHTTIRRWVSVNMRVKSTELHSKYFTSDYFTINKATFNLLNCLSKEMWIVFTRIGTELL
jgi:hypothetical protein